MNVINLPCEERVCRSLRRHVTYLQPEWRALTAVLREAHLPLEGIKVEQLGQGSCVLSGLKERVMAPSMYPPGQSSVAHTSECLHVVPFLMPQLPEQMLHLALSPDDSCS